MNTINKFLAAAALAIAVTFSAVAQNATDVFYSRGVCSTGLVTAAALTTNALVDVANPAHSSVGGYGTSTATGSLLTRVIPLQKDRGISIWTASGGQVTNSVIHIQQGVMANDKTNWTTVAPLLLYLSSASGGVAGGVQVSNFTAAVLGNVRFLRPLQLVNTNGAGSAYLTNFGYGYFN